MYESREYQQQALAAVASGDYRNYVFAWHRRAGKDRTALEVGKSEAMSKPGTYWHLFPKQSQARDAIWDHINRDTGGRTLFEVFPREIIHKQSDNRTALWLTSGSKWQMRGSDDYDSLMGGECQGAIFSEFDLSDPAALAYVSPIVKESGGWLMFISTYRNKFRTYRLARLNRNNPEWYVDVRSINDTKREDGSPVVTWDEVQKDIDAGVISLAKAKQEYLMDPGTVVENAYLEHVLERTLAA